MTNIYKNEENCAVIYPKKCVITEEQLLNPNGLNGNNPAKCNVIYPSYYDEPQTTHLGAFHSNFTIDEAHE